MSDTSFFFNDTELSLMELELAGLQYSRRIMGACPEKDELKSQIEDLRNRIESYILIKKRNKILTSIYNYTK